MNNKQFIIRDALQDDLAKAKDLADDLRDELGFIKSSVFIEVIRKKCFIVCAIDNNVIGFVLFNYRGGTDTTIRYMGVDKRYRRQGIATAMLRNIEQKVIDNGGHTIHLKCPIDSQANIFYQQFGFIHTASEFKRDGSGIKIYYYEVASDQAKLL